MAQENKMKRKTKTENVPTNSDDGFTTQLIKELNKEMSSIVAYNLSTDMSPTHVKRWIPTGIVGLDYICSNIRGGGLPEGRIVEIFGPPAIGKSHIAAQICKQAQLMGGIAVYIDSETAISVENLRKLGVDVSKNFVYVNEHCTENILSIAERTIIKAREMSLSVPVVIIWDSVAASSPKAELDGDYDKETIGLQARAISKGMRKITGIIGDQNVLFVILNQIRSKIGAIGSDPTVTPGGQALPFHASLRIRLYGGSMIENSATKQKIGINVMAKVIKNRLAAPHRTCNFQIHFGVGIKEHEELFDFLREAGPHSVGEKVVSVFGDGSWKTLRIFPASEEDWDNPKHIEIERKFRKDEFKQLMRDPEVGSYVNDLIEKAYVTDTIESDIDVESQVEIDQLESDVQTLLGVHPEQ